MHAHAYEIAIAERLQAQRLSRRHAGNVVGAEVESIPSFSYDIFIVVSESWTGTSRRRKARIFADATRGAESRQNFLRILPNLGHPGEVTEGGKFLGQSWIARFAASGDDVSSRDYIDDHFINARCTRACVIPCFRKERFLECAHSDSYGLSVVFASISTTRQLRQSSFPRLGNSHCARERKAF